MRHLVTNDGKIKTPPKKSILAQRKSDLFDAEMNTIFFAWFRGNRYYWPRNTNYVESSALIRIFILFAIFYCNFIASGLPSWPFP